jgi:hypothetical protein
MVPAALRGCARVRKAGRVEDPAGRALLAAPAGVARLAGAAPVEARRIDACEETVSSFLHPSRSHVKSPWGQSMTVQNDITGPRRNAERRRVPAREGLAVAVVALGEGAAAGSGVSALAMAQGTDALAVHPCSDSLMSS